jgi:hypothetical protein
VIDLTAAKSLKSLAHPTGYVGRQEMPVKSEEALSPNRRTDTTELHHLATSKSARNAPGSHTLRAGASVREESLGRASWPRFALALVGSSNSKRALRYLRRDEG